MHTPILIDRADNYVPPIICAITVRLVFERQPYREMSRGVYDEYRDDSHPTAETVAKRLGGGSFVRARQVALGKVI